MTTLAISFEQCLNDMSNNLIADYKLDQFAKVIEKYGWTETEVLADGYYNDHSREHVFNG